MQRFETNWYRSQDRRPSMTRNQRYGGHTGPAQTKKQERAIREAHRREKKINSYLADDENFPSFAVQLKKLGLQLRDIPGDGNCLFRALGDQLEGHGRNHYQHRLETVQYMLAHRNDFEPFVEDDVPFDDHISNLRRPGTYAGNDAIVAFAKLHNRNVMIHQLNGKPLMIQGPSSGTHVHQLHIAYHNGDHYSSIRREGDNSESPANIHLQEDSKLGAPSYSGVRGGDSNDHVWTSEGMKYLADEVMRATGYQDEEYVKDVLEDCDLDVDTAIATLMQTLDLGVDTEEFPPPSQHASNCGLWAPDGTGSRIFGGEVPSHSSVDRNGQQSLGGEESYSGSSSNSSLNCNLNRGSGARPKHSVVNHHSGPGRRTKEQRKMEKKRRAEERHRQKFSGTNTQPQLPQEPQQEDTLVITHDITRI